MTSIFHWLAVPSSFGIINALVIVLPFAFGSLYFIVKFFLLVICRVRRDFLHDPRPMRVWYTVAIFNICLAPLLSLESKGVSVTIGTLLIVFALYLCNLDFGTEF